MINFKAIPLNVVPDEIESFNKAVGVFNSCQKQFHLELSDPCNLPTAEIIEWANIKIALESVYSQSRIVAVTSKKFSDNWFSHSEDKITVISTSDWNKIFSPPGLHCYLLLEFALASYFHASDISEMASEPHIETQGCLIDLCANKSDAKWKLKVGHICSFHGAHFITYGGSEAQLDALQKLLDEVRRVSLGKPQLCHENISPERNNGEFNLESIKKHPIVVAAIIITIGISIGWGVAFKVWVEPKNERINNLEKKVTEIENKNNINVNSDKKTEPTNPADPKSRAPD